MKKAIVLMLAAALLWTGCAGTSRYNTQKGAAIGAGLGAIAGQAIGRDTESTLIGTGVGTLLGTIVGNMEDQRAVPESYSRHPHPAPPQETVRYSAPAPQAGTDPPGTWVRVPGHWEGNRWVPGHQEWRPVNPY